MSRRNYIFYDVSLWFLTSLFTIELAFYLIRKYIKNDIVIILVLFILGYIGAVKYGTLGAANIQPWSFDASLYYIIFYGIGNIIKERNAIIVRSRIITYVVLIISLILNGMIYFSPGHFWRIFAYRNILNRGTYNYITSIIIAFFGIISYIFISKLVRKSKVLKYLGKNSLIILALHQPLAFYIVGNNVKRLAEHNITITNKYYLFSIFYSTASILVLIPCIYIINKYIPWIMGKGINREAVIKRILVVKSYLGKLINVIVVRWKGLKHRKVILSMLLLFCSFLLLYLIMGINIIKYPSSIKTYDIFFSGDVPRVISDLTIVQSNHYRTKVHPLFVLFFNPIGSVLKHLVGSPEMAAVFMTATVGAITVVLVFIYLILLELELDYSIILSVIFGFSTSQIVFSSIPETFVFGAATLLISHISAMLSIKGNKLALKVLALSGIFVIGVTVTNYIQTLILFCMVALWIYKKNDAIAKRKALKYLFVSIGVSIILSFGLSVIQKQIYPSTTEFFKGSEEELVSMKFGNYTAYDMLNIKIGSNKIIDSLEKNLQGSQRIKEIKKICIENEDVKNSKKFSLNASNISRALILNFGFHNILAPNPEITTVYNYKALRFSNTNFNYGVLAIVGSSIWALIFIISIYLGFKYESKLFKVIFACTIFNIILHSIYDTFEAFLFSEHITFLLILMVGVAISKIKDIRPKLYSYSKVACILLLALQLVTNSRFILFIFDFLKKYHVG